ncbi:MAG TPA: nuclear transport factor 2 family protein [Gammaproteobacteria bacterium]|jgi:ketosteroid isomerase-like protein|nr:nuclear transport factor 2 family protein [Gammaproteobacteria bacterium]
MATELSVLERLKIRVALEDLNTAFCYHLDHNEVEALLQLFTEDVLYTHGSRRTNGKAELEKVFRSRTATSPRTSRHLYSGLRLEIESATHARGTSVCMTFGQNGVPPLAPAVPILVADFADVYERGADGHWRIRDRHIDRIFVDSHASAPLGHKVVTPLAR